MTEIANLAAYDRSELMTNTSEIVSAFITRNNMTPEQVAPFIGQVMGALNATPATGTAPADTGAADKPTPAQVRKSITPDGITSFIDGKVYKSMKRHLNTHNHTPESYRTHFGLPADYPMVAANYSAARSELARNLGLGQQRRKSAAEAPPVAETKAPGKPKKKTPGA